MKTIAFPFPVESLIDRVHDDDGTERIQSEKMPAAAVAAAPSLSLSRSRERNSLTYATLAVYGFLVWFVCYWFVRHENFLVVFCLCGWISISLCVRFTCLRVFFFLSLSVFSLSLPPIMQRSAAKWESAEEHTFIHSSDFVRFYSVKTVTHHTHTHKSERKVQGFPVKMAIEP